MGASDATPTGRDQPEETNRKRPEEKPLALRFKLLQRGGNRYIGDLQGGKLVVNGFEFGPEQVLEIDMDIESEGAGYICLSDGTNLAIGYSQGFLASRARWNVSGYVELNIVALGQTVRVPVESIRWMRRVPTT